MPTYRVGVGTFAVMAVWGQGTGGAVDTASVNDLANVAPPPRIVQRWVDSLSFAGSGATLVTDYAETGLSLLVAAATTGTDIIHREELGLSIPVAATTVTTTETAHDKELALVVPVVATTTATDLLHRKELGLSVPAAAATTATDLLHLKELTLAVATAATVVSTDLLHDKELGLSITVAATATSTDALHNRELSLATTIASTVTLADTLHNKELGLSATVAATVTATDTFLAGSVSNNETGRQVPITSLVTSTDFIHLKELSLSVSVAVTTTLVDTVHSKELGLSVPIAAATTSTTNTAHRKELAGSISITATTTATDNIPSGAGAWQAAVDSGNLATIRAWYAANTGYLAEGFLESSMWGNANLDIEINPTWLTANAAAGRVVNDGGGHWTVTGLRALHLEIQTSHLTLRHCHVDSQGTNTGWGYAVTDPVTGLVDSVSNTDLRVEYCTFEGGGMYPISNKQLTSNVATLTYSGTPQLQVGNKVEIRLSPADPTFDAVIEFGGSQVTITAATATTFSYARTHANVASTPVTGGYATTSVEGPSFFGDVLAFDADPTTVTPDTLVMDHCLGKDYRAAFMCGKGVTVNYCWVPSLDFYGVDPHNTSASIRGKYCTLYRNFFEEGTSSDISCYADNYPYTDFYITENIVHVDPTHAIHEILFPTRPPTNWHPLEQGFIRECTGNVTERGVIDDAAYFTKTWNNRLLDGTPILMDEGTLPVPTEPVLLKMRWNSDGGGAQEFLDTYEFAPSPNSTLLLFAGVVQGGHTTAPAPVVTVVGQYPQTFTAVTSSVLEDNAGNDSAHAMKLWLYKAQTGGTTTWEHIRFDPYTGTQIGYICFWVYEITGVTGMTLAHSVATMKHAAGSIDNITTGALSGAATNGNLSMAFAACDDNDNGAPGLVSGWEQIGVQNINMSPGNPAVTGAMYWRKDFTSTTFTIPDLGTDVSVAGVLLTEFTIPFNGNYDETNRSITILSTVTATSQADYEDHPLNLAVVATTATLIQKAALHEPGLAIPIASVTSVTDAMGRQPENLSVAIIATVTSTDQADFHNTALAVPITASTTGTDKAKRLEPGLTVPITGTTTVPTDRAHFQNLTLSVPITAFVTAVALQSSAGHYDETQRVIQMTATTTLAVDQADFDEFTLVAPAVASTGGTDTAHRRDLALALPVAATVTVIDVQGVHYVETQRSVTSVSTVTATNQAHFRNTTSLSVVAAVSLTDPVHRIDALTISVIATVTASITTLNAEELSVLAGSTVTSTDLIHRGELALSVSVSATVSVAHALAAAIRLTLLIQAVIRVTDFKSRVGITILNDAESVFLGDEQVSRVYVGASQAWP